MIQEYLFVESDNKEELKKYEINKKISLTIEDIEDSNCWIALFDTGKNDATSAHLLSDLHNQIIHNYNPIVLSNECAAYYNKALYPIINEFERKLRKLLYLKSALNKGNKDADAIKDLEKQDLGKIFDLLFTDENYITKIKSKINSKSWKFSKIELEEVVLTTEEQTLWDNLLGKDTVSFLREKFNDIRIFRNDVMHAHDINEDRYNEIKVTYKKVNEQLDFCIGTILNNNNDIVPEIDFNEAISNAIELAAQPVSGEYLRNIINQVHSNVPKLDFSYLEMLSNSLLSIDDIENIKRNIKIALPAIETYQQLLDSIKQIQPLISQSNKMLESIKRENSSTANTDKTVKEKNNEDIKLHGFEETTMNEQENENGGKNENGDT